MNEKQMEQASPATPSQWAEAKADVEFYIQHNAYSLFVALEDAAQIIEQWNAAQGFWQSENKGEKYMLMVTELGEGFEGVRKPGLSDKIGSEEYGGFTIEEEELADLFIRALDYTGHFKLRLGLAIAAKLRYNLTREFMHGKVC